MFMAQLVALFVRLRCDRGVTSIEYALISGLIALAIIAAVTALGATLQANYQNTADQIAAAGA